MDNQLYTPILFIIFNRPDSTRRVFEAIKKARPTQLFISADGPREDKIGEKEKCEETRKITEAIDWPCEVGRNYSEANKGCKIGVSSAVTWFFENVPAGIILEDDCLPDPSFFPYCQELLERYKDDDKIKMISGDNFQQGNIRGDGSYYFSKLPQIWGWATWKHAWDNFDLEMKGLDENNTIPSFWRLHFKHIRDNNIDTWDAQWVYSIMKADGLSITPNANLIENIGFDENATHTNSAPSYAMQKSQPLRNLVHPSKVTVSQEADEFLMNNVYKKGMVGSLIGSIKSFLGGLK